MFVLALIILGWTARGKMPAELYPNIEFPFVTVVSVYPGAGPQEIETLITEPIERAVSSVGNIRHVTSTSQDGISTVGMEFELGTNLDSAAADVRDKVSAVRRQLPRDLEPPSITKVDISAMPVLTIGMIGPPSVSNKQMRILADDVIKDRLSKVGGVAGVYVSGGDQREVLVSVDRDRLDAYGASIGDIADALRSENLNLPSGSIKEGAREYAVRTVGEFTGADEIRDLRITVNDSVVRLGDIATVRDTVAEPTTLTRLNGKPTVVMAVVRQTDANTVDVAEGVKRELKQMTGGVKYPSGFDKLRARLTRKPAPKPVEIRGILPRGVKPVVATDQSIFVEDALHDVNRALFEGVALVVLIVFLFLHSARATFIVAVAIPTSIFATFLPMRSAGFSLNMMTMLALSLAVGILVDDSIVVLENIERHLRLGEPPREAALNGRSEIGLAAITITMVDVVVFIPIAFMGGIVGQFFKQFGITIAAATLFSLFMSFTLTPMMASRWMSRANVESDLREEEEERRYRQGRSTMRLNDVARWLFGGLEVFYRALDTRYRALLQWALENRLLTVVIGFASLLVVFALAMPPATAAIRSPRVVIALIAAGLSAWAFAVSKSKGVAAVFGLAMIYMALVVRLPFGAEMMPPVDQGEFAVMIETPAGTSLKATDVLLRKVEAILAKEPGMAFYQGLVGSTSSASEFGGGDTGSQYGRISAKLVDRTLRSRSVDQVADDVARKVALIPGGRIRVAVSGRMGPAGSPLQMDVTGNNIKEMAAVADKVAAAMNKVKGVIDVESSYKIGKPEARITVDRIRAADMGVSVGQIATALRTSIEGNTDAKLRDSGSEYDIRVRLTGTEASEINRPNDLQNVRDVSSVIVGYKDSSPVYLRDVARVDLGAAPSKLNRKDRQKLITVGANLVTGYVLGNVQNEVNKEIAKIPLGNVDVKTGGTGQIMTESFMYMLSAMLLAIVLVYMLMAALFESFASPFVIMFALPQAMVGALLALLVTGKSLSIVSMIGIIMLMGLVTKNAILLVDYTNTLRSRGKNRTEAILESGPTRLRPILMTTLAMVGGMLPTALAVSRGSEQRAPMAIAVIGGLIVSTLLTLIVIPVVYTIVDDWTGGLMRRLRGGRAEAAGPSQPAQEIAQTVES